MKNQQKAKNIANNIGLAVQPPKKICQDQHCPFHASQKLRGRTLSGFIKKTDAFKTATITFERVHPLPKYERYEKRTSRLRVHNPPCLNAQPGDKVMIVETRPISKTKNFVIIEVEKVDKVDKGAAAGVHKNPPGVHGRGIHENPLEVLS